MGRFEHHLPAPSSTANCLFSCLYAPWWNWFKCRTDEYLYWLNVTDWIRNLKRTLGASRIELNCIVIRELFVCTELPNDELASIRT